MKLTRLFRIGSAVAAIAIADFASAAVVSFSTANLPQTGTDYSLIQNAGTLLSAINFSTNPVRTETFSSTNPDPNVTLNGIAFTPQSGIGASGTYFTTNATGVDTARFSAVDYTSSSNLYGLVYDVAITGSNTTNLSFNLQNLTIGQDYRVQFIFSSNSTESTRRRISVAAGTFTAEGAGYLGTRGTGSDGTSDIAYYADLYGPAIVTATFTADATTELFTMLGNQNFEGEGNSRVSLAGFTLAAVPEPGTLALIVTGALGLGATIVRRRSMA